VLKDYFALAVGSLRKRFLRTSLTMLGIFIGIAAVVSLVSLGQGMQSAINAQFAAIGTDKIIVQGASAGFGPPGSTSAGSVGERDLDIIQGVPGVRRAAGGLLRSATIELGDEADVFVIRSLPSGDPGERDLTIESLNLKTVYGRLLKEADKRKILVGHHLWTVEHFPRPIILGSKLRINGLEFEVVGLMDKIGAGRDEIIVMNEGDARDVLGEPEKFSAIFAQVVSGAEPAKVADSILRALRRDRHQKEGFEDVTVETSEELIGSINTILGVVQAVFIGIALISLLVGGIGIMNTMYTAVLERRRDIGIMKAIGARNKDVLLIFLLESGLLGMSGGAVGIVLGIGMSKLVELGARGAIGNLLQASFPWYLIAGALGFSFTIGVISGVLPARQASSLPPVEALRGD
jgi:putative ABC transport system permease protein